MSELTQEQFLQTVKNHEINIIKDDGVYRYILFKNPSDGDRWFELITWPGSLCIGGDMGTYVFSRINDMFDFFRKEKINADYWHQKMVADSKFEKAIEFSPQLAENYVKENLQQYLHNKTTSEKERIISDVLTKVDFYSGVDGLIYSLGEFEDYESGLTLEGFTENMYEHNFETYTYHFLWCLYAIVWGIGKYDEANHEPQTA